MELSLENTELWAEKARDYWRKQRDEGEIGRGFESTQGVILFEARLSKELAPTNIAASQVNEVEAHLRLQLTDELTKSIRKYISTVSVGQDLLHEPHYGTIFPKNKICSLRVLEHLSQSTGSTRILIGGNDIVVAVYHMRDQDEDVGIDEEVSQFASVTAMPNEETSNIFQGLIFGDGIRSSIVAMVIKTLKYVRIREGQDNIIAPFGRVLLYGPPGTGKSSLAISIAHIVAIHHQAIGPTVLVQVEAGHLINHMFGESSSRLIRLFDAIDKFCQEEPDQFVCIIIDEVEALAGTRQGTKGNDCGIENTRVTGALLRGMDNLKPRANCFTICTTNLIERLDPAFVDRLGLKWKIDAPGLQPIYEILRSSLQTMMLDGIIPKEEVPPYVFAKKMAFDGELSPGASLYFIAYQVFSLYREAPISARILRQLPQQAWLCCLDTSLPNFSHMLDILNTYVQNISSDIGSVKPIINDKTTICGDSHITLSLTNVEKLGDPRIDSTESSHMAAENVVIGGDCVTDTTSEQHYGNSENARIPLARVGN